MTDRRQFERLARQVDTLDRRVSGLSAPQLGNSSFQAGQGQSIDEIDPTTGLPVSSFGTQYDGTHGAVPLSSPTPPTPTTPLVEGGVGILTATWDGLYVGEDGQTDIMIVSPLGFAYVEVHASTEGPGFDARTTATLLGTINTARGAGNTIGLPAGTYYVRLVARTTAGKASEASAAAPVTVFPAVDADGLETIITDQMATYLTNTTAGGYTSTINGQGLQVTYNQLDGAGNIVQVQKVIQLGTFGEDLISLFKDGKASFTANAEGDVAARTLAATDEIYYKGDALTDLFWRRPWGHVSAAYRNTDQDYNSVSDFPEQPYLRLDVELIDGRLYKIWTSPIRMGVTPGYRGIVRLRGQVNGVATDTSPIINQVEIAAEGLSTPLQELWTPTVGSGMVPGTKRQCSFLISNVTPTGGGASGIRAGDAYPVRLEVEDVGPTISTGNGVWLVGANQSTPAPPPPPSRVTYDETFPNQDRRTYAGNGAVYTWPYPRGAQGLSPAGYGNLNSIWTFEDILGRLSGAIIHEVWAYFKFDQWYYGSGGTARIGLHGNLGLPGSFNAPTWVAADSGGWPAGADRWIKIPEAHYGGFANGTYRGFTLLGDGTLGTYGLASNSQLRIVYSK